MILLRQIFIKNAKDKLVYTLLHPFEWIELETLLKWYKNKIGKADISHMKLFFCPEQSYTFMLFLMNYPTEKNIYKQTCC